MNAYDTQLNYVARLQSIVKEVYNDLKYDQLLEHGIYKAETAPQGMSQLISDLKEHAQGNTIINGVFQAALLDAFEEYKNGESSLIDTEKEGYDGLLKFTLIVLDLCIYTSYEANALTVPMEILLAVITEYPIEFITKKFGPFFFHMSSEERRNLIATETMLIGKKAPGKTLLVAANNILPRLTSNFKENDIFSGKFRTYISNHLSLSDKVTSNADWSFNSYGKMYMKPSKSSSRRDMQYTNLDTLYEDYMALCCALKDPYEIIKDFNIKPQDRKAYRLPPTSVVLDLMRSIMRVLFDLNKEQHVGTFKDSTTTTTQLTAQELEYLRKEYDSKIYECEWIQSPNAFMKQVKNYKSRKVIMLQIIMMNHYLQHSRESDYNEALRRAGITEPNEKLKTFKPPVFLTNDRVYDILRDQKQLYISRLRDFDPTFYQLLLHATIDVESSWTSWKLKSFKIDMLQPEENPDKKRKLEEYLSSVDEYKKPYVFSVGTPRLSKLWKTETGLDRLKRQKLDKEDLLDTYRMDLYRINSELDSTDSSEDLMEKKAERDTINWKAMTICCQTGNWVKFNQTNERVGIEGVFNSDLLEEDIQKQKEIADAKKQALLNKDKEDKEADSNTPEPATTEDKVEKDE